MRLRPSELLRSRRIDLHLSKEWWAQIPVRPTKGGCGVSKTQLRPCGQPIRRQKTRCQQSSRNCAAWSTLQRDRSHINVSRYRSYFDESKPPQSGSTVVYREYCDLLHRTSLQAAANASLHDVPPGLLLCGSTLTVCHILQRAHACFGWRTCHMAKGSAPGCGMKICSSTARCNAISQSSWASAMDARTKMIAKPTLHGSTALADRYGSAELVADSLSCAQARRGCQARCTAG